MSQLLRNIEDLIKTSSSRRERAILAAKKASYLSRVGDFEAADRIILNLHADYQDGHDGLVTAWKMLAEGINQLYKDLNPSALDRISRAQFLAAVVRNRELQALSTAWKSHIEYEISDFDSMAKSIRFALEMLDVDNHDAFTRVAMVLADINFLIGRREQAQIFFLLSKSHANALGDQATIDALLYNRAAFGMAWFRAQKCIQSVAKKDIDLIRLEIASAQNFQTIAGVSALANFIALCDARLALIADSFEEAINKLQEIRNSRPFAPYNFAKEFIDLEVAYCLAKLGRLGASKQMFDSAKHLTFEMLDIDERLVAAWLKYNIYLAYSEFDSARAQEKVLDRIRLQYTNHRVHIIDLIEQFDNFS